MYNAFKNYVRYIILHIFYLDKIEGYEMLITLSHSNISAILT